MAALTTSYAAVLIFCILLATSASVAAHDRLCFFGDSYLDTGNFVPPQPKPYGETWPGKPNNRWSDGVVFADVFSTYLKINLPIPYSKLSGNRTVRDGGVNYAVGGTKAIAGPDYQWGNLSVQVSQFEDMVSKGSFATTGRRLMFIAVISVGGLDYANIFTALDKEKYTERVTKVLGVIEESANRMLKAGVKTFYLLTLPPAGCLPLVAFATAYTDCIERVSRVTTLHNNGLRAIRNRLATKGSDATILDIEKCVNSIVNNPRCFGFSNVLAPCCVGVTVSSEKLEFGCTSDTYTVCDRPERRLFFDSIHPTDAGWRSIISLLAIGNNFTSPAPNLCSKVVQTCEGSTNGSIPALPRPIDGGSCNETDILSASANIIRLPSRTAYGALFVLGLVLQLYFWL